MGLVLSLIVIAVGAILIWGVNADSTDFNVDAIGVILMVIGFVGFLLSLLFWRTWWGPGAWVSRRDYVEGPPRSDPHYDRGRRVTRVEEEEEASPPPPP